MHKYLAVDGDTATPIEILTGENWTIVDANMSARESKIPVLEAAIGGGVDRNAAADKLDR
ncbi:hypothetical protein P4U43_06230 [Arthrobacter sp. EH-1B-1]|uniref:Uncharacterized protein n=2 Tax=Arthrobacter vasquezii TaxID=2977629 RepID=A0ABT6CTN4_9MICC|nr:hypothetical protein [Arthrobacter vasquezii]